MALELTNFGRVSRAVPQAVAEAGNAELRVTPYGDQHVVTMVPTKHMLTDERQYIVATNPTPSTGVAYGSGGTQATFSDTAGFMVVKNNASPADLNAKSLFMDYIRLIVGGTVPASATSTQFAIKIDNKDRTPSANASQITPQNLNLRSSDVKGQLWVPSAGIPTVPASGGSARLVARGALRHSISVVLDEYELRFGVVDSGPAIAATVAGRYVSVAPPVVLGPQEFMVLHLWQPSGATNPLTVEFEVGWFER